MPRENWPAARSATSVRPTMSSTSSTRRAGMPDGGGQGQQVVAGRALGVHGLGFEQGAHLGERGPDGRRSARPPTVADPAVGASSPRIIRMVVDLPAPLGPRNPVTMPGRTVKLRSSTAVVGP